VYSQELILNGKEQKQKWGGGGGGGKYALHTCTYITSVFLFCTFICFVGSLFSVITKYLDYFCSGFNQKIPLPSDRQHPSYGDCLEVKREYYQNCSAGLCDTVFTVSSTLIWAVIMKSNRLHLLHWDPYAVCRGSCLDLYYCNMVEWVWWDSSLISTINWFLQYFDTVSLIIWPVKIVLEMTIMRWVGF